jgi:predicted enzyme related to lactoylglutathione lyase
MLTAMIFAMDHDALVAFYGEGLGLAVDPAASSPGYTVLVGDGVRVAIHAVPGEVGERISIGDPPQARSASAIKLLFEVGDLGSTCDRLVELGGQMFETAQDDARDGLDPEGNVFRVSGRASS